MKFKNSQRKYSGLQAITIHTSITLHLKQQKSGDHHCHSPTLLADGGGIVNLSTGLARFSFPGYSAYASMKGAVETFTKYLAKELGARGIRANAVAPGAINTDFTKDRFDAHPELRGMLASQTALGRVGEADDIGGVIAFLCTDDARWVNAQRIEASGGMFL